MKIIEMLKNRNRTLLELHIGILFWTLAATAAGAVLPLGAWGLAQSRYFCGLWTAAAGAAAAAAHMQRCLENALDAGEGAAGRLVTRGYLIRYVILAAVLAACTATELLNPLVLCLAYILIMKAAAYSQPFTHRFCNKLFHETDPVPEPVSDEEWNRE